MQSIIIRNAAVYNDANNNKIPPEYTSKNLSRGTNTPVNTTNYPIINDNNYKNGFKFRNSNGDFNGSGRTYIYMAFAENPFRNSLAR